MSRPKLVIATRNAGKRREFAELLAGLPVEVVDLSAFPDAPDVPEDAATYEANARAKAEAIARHTGLPALADDSGLEVDHLGGEPGVRSARYAGPDRSDSHNLALVLERLRSVPEPRRTARFRCVIVVARPDGASMVAEGTCEGRIAAEPSGDRGFGYDPIFFFEKAGRTFAEMDPAEKNRRSHRAAACENLRPRLAAFLANS